MKFYSLGHLTDRSLLHELTVAVRKEGTAMAVVVAHIAEVDARQLYREAGHLSMLSYCVSELALSESEAYKRIQVARLGREYPAIFEALTEGRLNLTGAMLLSGHLNPANIVELLELVCRKKKGEIERLLAERFPRSEMLPLIEATSDAEPELVVSPLSCQLAPERVRLTSPRVTPIAKERYALHVSISEQLNEKPRHAQDLLGHQIPSGDIPQVLELALDELIRVLEKRKFAVTEHPRAPKPCSTSGGRSVPAHVRRAVRERDADQCTFVSDGGHRCPARKFLEFDHVLEVARGGQSTVDNIRLRCPTHNQCQAERTFGPELMHRKREERRNAAASREQTAVMEQACEEQGSEPAGDEGRPSPFS